MGSPSLDMSIPVPDMGKLVMGRDKREQHEDEAQGCSAKPMIDAGLQNFVSPPAPIKYRPTPDAILRLRTLSGF